MNIATKFDYASIPAGTKFGLKLKVGIEATSAPDKDRKPLNISMVIDRSGSMQGDKIEYVKTAAKFFLSQLHGDDILSVVIFDNEVDALVQPFTAGSPNNAESLISSIHARGMTNLSEGYLKGCSLAARYASNNHVSRVMLLTDGMANQGITNSATLAELAAKQQAKGITTSTIGVGEGYDEELLGRLSENGGGGNYFIETPDDAPDVFKEELGYLQSLVATDLQVRFIPENREFRIGQLNTYPVSDGGTYLLGDVYSAQQKSIIMMIETPEMEIRQGVRIGTLHVSYRDAVSSEQDVLKTIIPVVLDVVSQDDFNGTKPNREVAIASAYLLVARAIKDAIRTADEGNFEDAAKILETQARELEAMNLADERLNDEIRDIKERARNLRDYRERYYTLMEKKFMYHTHKKMSLNQLPSMSAMKFRRSQKQQPRKRDTGDSSTS